MVPEEFTRLSFDQMGAWALQRRASHGGAKSQASGRTLHFRVDYLSHANAAVANARAP
jgi:hypothetical protein